VKDYFQKALVFVIGSAIITNIFLLYWARLEGNTPLQITTVANIFLLSLFTLNNKK